MEKDQLINPSKYFILSEYRKEMLRQALLINPNLDKKKFIKIMDKSINKNFIDTNCHIYNNYTEETRKTTLARFLNWHNKEKPITTEQGVMFSRHSKKDNKAMGLITMLLDERAAAKAKMFQYPKGSPMFDYWNIIQKVYKIIVNSYYGVSGQRQSAFFNLHVALSITAKGQSIISTALTTFEKFLSNNIKFKNFSECISFINNVVREDYDILNIIDKVKDTDEVYDYLETCFMCKITDYDKQILKQVLENLDENNLNKIYYKNNLYKFCLNRKPSVLLNRIFKTTNEFLDPNKVPEEIQDTLDKLWLMFKTCIVYNHIVPDKINRLKYDIRKTVILVDTDSNVLNLDPWVKFTERRFKLDTTNKETRYTIINVMAYCLTNLIKLSYATYTKNCNIEEEPAKFIKMKNEFLFKRLLLTSNKKSYASILELQEGHIIDPVQLDIKGLDVKKANFNQFAGESLQNILENNILRSEHLKIDEILRKLVALQDDIRNSLSQGYTKYSSPDKASDITSYKTPYQIGVVRGIILFNALDLGEEIVTPAQVNTLKIKAPTLADLKDLYKSHPDIYNIIKETIFDDKNLEHYGVTIIALPKSFKKVPDWLIPYIDVDTMVSDCMKKSLSFLEATGLQTIEVTKTDTFFSNIIDF